MQLKNTLYVILKKKRILKRKF